MNDPIPRIDYLPKENNLWNFLYEKLSAKIHENGCKEYLKNFSYLEKIGIFQKEKIP